MLSRINHYFLKFESNGLIWIYRYAPSNLPIRRVRPAFYCSLDPGAFPASASKGVSYTAGTHPFCRCVLSQRLWPLVSGKINPVYLWWKDKPSRLVNRNEVHQRCPRAQGYLTRRAPLGQCFPLDGENGVCAVAWGRSQQNSLSIFISYHTPNVQHWTQFCFFDVRNINCLKKQYTNKLLEIKNMQTSLPFCCLQKTQFTVSINRAERKKIQCTLQNTSSTKEANKYKCTSQTYCSNYANTHKLTWSHSKL